MSRSWEQAANLQDEQARCRRHPRPILVHDTLLLILNFCKSGRLGLALAVAWSRLRMIALLRRTATLTSQADHRPSEVLSG